MAAERARRRRAACPPRTSCARRACSARRARAMALWSMGANQSTVGTLKNRALINLCLATGNIGRPGSGPLSLTGQPNAMGGRETGGLADLLPGYRHVTDPEHRAEMRRLWDIPADAPGIAPAPGIAGDRARRRARGRPRQGGLDRRHQPGRLPARRRSASPPRCGAPSSSSCQDAYHPTETSALAHVVLPAAQWPEKDGTMTNSERRVGLDAQARSTPPGDALPDWEIFARVGRALGHARAVRLARRRPRCYDEFAAHDRGAAVRPDRASPTRGCAARARCSGPCPHAGPTATSTRAPSGSTLGRRFPTPDGRARLAADAARRAGRRARRPTSRSSSPPAASPHQWHTMTRTGKSTRPARAPSPSRSSSCTRADAAARRRRATASACACARAADARRCARASATRCPRASRSRRSTGARCTSTPGARRPQRRRRPRDRPHQPSRPS